MKPANNGRNMIIVHVHVRVKPEAGDAFMRATLENAAQSRKERGIARFDVLRRDDDPFQFLLVEIYRDSAAVGEHKQTAHYAAWRDTVASMMAEPRRSEKFERLSPAPDHGSADAF